MMLATTKNKLFPPPPTAKATVCASCRLRAGLAAKRWSRQRRNSALHAVSAPLALDMLVAMRSFSTSAVQHFPRIRGRGDGRQEEERRILEEEGLGDELAMARRPENGRRVTAGRSEKEGEYIVYSDELDAELAGEIRAAQQLHLRDEGQGSLDGNGGKVMNDRLPLEDENERGEESADHITRRTHPLTLANRFGTHPTTIQLPASSFVEPTALILSGTPPVHLSTAAHRLLGGPGLPHSPSTPAIARTMQQKAPPLGPAQTGMREIEADVFLAAVAPGVYASLLSVLADTRRRLGTKWAEGLVCKAAAGELRVLDAGGGGAGILAVREVLRAEWERMHEQEGRESSETGLAEADGRVGGAGVSPPLGHATVLTASAALRRRASQLLEDTTFVPRLPEYVPGVDGQEKNNKGKFDIIVAPHTLWPLWPDHLRKTHVLNLWDLLRADGGVLVLLEKGVGKGFEAVAAARELLLERRIATAEARVRRVDDEEKDEHAPSEPVGADGMSRRIRNEGMIVGPCTNHAACPMYVPKGNVQGRKDVCHFEQRFIRPPFLQKLLGARDRNHEDIKFSYLAVLRGRDLRDTSFSSSSANSDDVEAADTVANHLHSQVIHQDQAAADQAFAGYGEETTEENPPHPLTLPITILPPLKRRGHVILDVCTPAGMLERWTVPRSFGRQAYHDARKARWGDSWALGAKSRVRKAVMGVNKHARTKAAEEGGEGRGEGGQMRRGKKIKGVRDKRNKKGVRVAEE